jgi:tRNA(fMet)-specific endonuclease VapC
MEDTITLDTDILIDLLRGNKETTENIKHLEQTNTPLTTTAINTFELHHGAWKTDNPPRNIQAAETLLNRLIQLSFTPQAAAAAGKILASLENEGQPIGFRDAFIAATVLENNTTLYTRNTRHFNRVPRLKIFMP